VKVGVLTEVQSPSDQPKDFVSKNAANAMCRRLTHIRVSKFLIQAVTVREFAAIAAREALPVAIGPIPEINAPGYYCLPYTYPLPAAILEHYQ
jgi:hypothetical protein